MSTVKDPFTVCGGGKPVPLAGFRPHANFQSDESGSVLGVTLVGAVADSVICGNPQLNRA
jgi:hypothetical protein